MHSHLLQYIAERFYSGFVVVTRRVTRVTDCKSVRVKGNRYNTAKIHSAVPVYTVDAFQPGCPSVMAEKLGIYCVKVGCFRFQHSHLVSQISAHPGAQITWPT